MKLFTRHNHFISLKIVAVCVVLFFLQIMFPFINQNFVLYQHRVLFEPWQILTSMFLHGSLGHLVFNMIGLALFGSILENIIGTRKFLYLYFGAGVVAALAGTFIYPAMLGASGAIMGVLGALAMLRPSMVIWVSFIPMRMWVASIVWVVIDLSRMFDPTSNIAALAHLGGIIVGFIVGWKLKPKYGEMKDPYLQEVELLMK